MNSLGKKGKTLLLGAVLGLSLLGCEKKSEKETKRVAAVAVGDENLSSTQLSLLYDCFWAGLDETYRPLFGDHYRELTVFSDSELSILSYEKEYRFWDEVTSLLTLCSLAAKEEVFLSEEEKEACLSGISGEDKDYRELCLKYALAEKEKKQLLSENTKELSAEEVRVMHVIVAETTDRLALSRVKEGLLKSKEITESLFLSLTAREGVTAGTERTLTHQSEDVPETVREAAFYCEDNTCTDVIEAEGKYYMILVKNHYDKALSQARKEELLAADEYMGWYARVDSSRKSLTVEIDQKIWNNLSEPEVGKTCTVTFPWLVGKD